MRRSPLFVATVLALLAIRSTASAQIASFKTVDPPNSVYAVAWGINATGVIVGVSSNGSTPDSEHAFSMAPPYDNAGSFNLPTANFSQATGINDTGKVSGSYVDKNLVTHGFFGTPQQASTIDFPSARETRGWGLNNVDMMVGAFASTDTTVHGYIRFSDGSFLQKDAPFGGTTITQAVGIDDSGVIVGVFDGCTAAGLASTLATCGLVMPATAGDGRFPPATTTTGGALFPPGSAPVPFAVPVANTYTAATEISNAGYIVGIFGGTDGNDHGFLAIPAGSALAATPPASAIPFVGLPAGYLFVQIDVPNALFTNVLGIDNAPAPTLVGAFGDANGQIHSFLGK